MYNIYIYIYITYLNHIIKLMKDRLMIFPELLISSTANSLGLNVNYSN